MYISVTVSPLSGWSISTCTHGLKYSNLSFVVYVLGGASTGSVNKYNLVHLFSEKKKKKKKKKCQEAVSTKS